MIKFQGGGGKATDIAANVSPTATGPIYTLTTRALSGTPTWSKVSGNANLTVSSGAISATAALTAGVSQAAIVRAVAGNTAVEFQVTLTGYAAPLAPATINTSDPIGDKIVQISLQSGETITAISPSNGKVTYYNGPFGSELLVGATASTAGTITYILTTSLGNAYSVAVTAVAPSLAATPSLFAALPLATGAQVAMIGDSYIERGISIYTNNVTITTTSGLNTATVTATALTNIAIGQFLVDARFPAGTRVTATTGGTGAITLSNNATASSTAAGQMVYGKNIDSGNLWSVLRSRDTRFGMEGFLNPAKPATYFLGNAYLDATPHGKSGTGYLDASFSARMDYVIARAPAIVINDIGKNDINGASASLATMQTQVTNFYNKFFTAKIWQVFQTQSAFRAGATPGDWTATGPELAVLEQFNDWLVNTVSTWSGVAGVIDTRDLDGHFSVANESIYFAADKLHLLPYGNWKRGDRSLAILRPLVQRSTVPLVSSAANVHPFKALSGTGGSKAPGATVTGSVATGMRVGVTTGDSVVCTKGTNADGEETQVIAVTPVGNGTARHNVGFTNASAITFATINTALTANSQSALAVDDWCEFSMRVRMDDWAGWIAGDATTLTSGTSPPGLLRVELTDSGAANSLMLETDGSGSPSRTMIMRSVFRIPGSADRLQALCGVTLNFLSNVGGTGIAVFDKPAFRKLTADPRTSWAL